MLKIIESRDSNRYLYIHTHRNIIHNSQKMEETQRSIHMDECINNMWYVHTLEYYSALKKEWNSDTCYNMYEPGGYYAMWKKLVPRIITFMEAAEWFLVSWFFLVVARSWEEGRMESFLMGIDFQLCKVKSLLEIDCTTTWMHLTVLNYTQKWLQWYILC